MWKICHDCIMQPSELSAVSKHYQYGVPNGPSATTVTTTNKSGDEAGIFRNFC